MKNRFILVGLVAMMSVLASAKTFIDKTNLDQLNYRVLDSGQFAWTEEDGSAVLYVGSPTEVKNIRVIDPTALRGYRYKTINDELSFNADDAFVSTVTSNSTTFTFTYKASQHESLKKVKYKDIEQTGGHGYSVTNNNIKINDWYDGLYVKNGDTYTVATGLPDGTIVGGTNQTYKSVQYAYGYKCITLTVDVIAHDTTIEELDFLYQESVSQGLGDMDPIHTSRRIIYDGRHARIEVDLTYTSGDGKFIKMSDFTAKCRGIGDVEMVNDLTQNKIFIYDKLAEEEGIRNRDFLKDKTDTLRKTLNGFDLSNLRYWAKHLYDGNRGEHWSKYPAYEHVNMSNRWFRFVGNYAHGPSGNGYTFAHAGNEFLSYENGESSGNGQYAGVQVAFTAINNASRTENGYMTDPLSLDIVIDVPAGKTRPPMDLFKLQWKDDLLDSLWLPINGVWTQTDADGLEWHIEVPEAYSGPLNKAGFYRIYLNSEPYANKVKITAELQVVGSDGYMYKLTWPSGGGAVTATLVD